MAKVRGTLTPGQPVIHRGSRWIVVCEFNGLVKIRRGDITKTVGLHQVKVG